MARDFIKVDKTQSAAIETPMLLSFISTYRLAMDQAARLKATMDHNTDGTVWTDIETLFGLPTGKGQTVYNLVAGSIGALNGTATDAGGKTLTEQVGG